MMPKGVIATVLTAAIVGGASSFLVSLVTDDRMVKVSPIAIVDYAGLLDVDDMDAGLEQLKRKAEVLSDQGWVVIDKRVIFGEPPSHLVVPVD